MSEIDDVLKANEDFARRFTLGHLSKRPARRLAVLTCMDARLSVEQALGLAPGDAHIIRNAGAIVTDDALRSLVLSHHELGAREIMIVGHTECAGINRHVVGDARALEERRTATPSWPRVLQGTPRGVS